MLTTQQAYERGFSHGLDAAQFSDWDETLGGAVYEAGGIDIHEAFDDLVVYAAEAEEHARQYGPYPGLIQAMKAAGNSKELWAAYEEGVADGIRIGAMRRIELDASGRKAWAKEDDPRRIQVYADIERDIEQRRTSRGFPARVPNLTRRGKAAIGSGAGALVGGLALGWPLGTVGGGAAGGALATPEGYQGRTAAGGAIGGLLGTLGAALGGYIGSADRKKNPDISHLLGDERIVAAERENGNVLIMRRLPQSLRRADGKEVTLELEHRWLTRPTGALSEVAGNDFTYWDDKEYEPGRGLFEQFQLFANPERSLSLLEGLILAELTEEPESRADIAEDLEGFSRSAVYKAIRDLEQEGMIRKVGRELALTHRGAVAEHRWSEELLSQGILDDQDAYARIANATQVQGVAKKLLVRSRNPGEAHRVATQHAQAAKKAKKKNLARFWNDVAGTIQGERKANLSPRARAALGAGLGAAAGGFFGTMIGGGIGVGLAAASEGGAAVAAVPMGGLLGFVLGSAGGAAAGGSAAAPMGYKRRAAGGGALGGVLGPLGAAGGAYLATEEQDKTRRRNVLKRRLIRR